MFPDDSTRYAIVSAAQTLRERGFSGRWVNPSLYHLTVHFVGTFGAVPNGMVRQAAAAASRVRVPPFDLELDAIGSFGNREVPVWLGCRTAPSGLAALHRRLLDELRLEGILPHDDKPLIPHVTLFRCGRPVASTPVPPVHWRVHQFDLIDSWLTPRLEYVCLGRWPLLDAAC